MLYVKGYKLLSWVFGLLDFRLRSSNFGLPTSKSTRWK